MFPVARVGDKTWGAGTHHHRDCPHTFSGTIVRGAPTVLAEGMPISRLGDMTYHMCPHCRVGVIAQGNPTVLSEGIPHAELGMIVNEFCGLGSIITSAMTVFG